ncbi:MAG: acyl-homoserine-lactone synthase [Gallionellaceae bacterium]|jgi:acyl homoserine lactone synthase|nr:acyl-homoserine-lactone synthase [Gallionellaceae bacterium]
MSCPIRIAPRSHFNNAELRSMHRLRAKVFKERMGWDVPILSGMEIDGYDTLDPYYMLIHGADHDVRGCWRLLPTEGPYMLKDSFPELLHGQTVPEDSKVWELSRFAIETGGAEHFSFAELVLDAMREIVNFGNRMGIERYVTVTTTAIERMLSRTGIAITRLGPPMRIGVAQAVALNIDIGKQTHAALFGAGAHDCARVSASLAVSLGEIEKMKFALAQANAALQNMIDKFGGNK